MSSRLEGRTVLVTGANRGIGKSIVEAALQRGATKVYAAVRRLESAQPLVEQFGERVVPIRIDLEDSDSIKAAATAASDVDLVINNAGVLKAVDLLDEAAFETLDFEIDVNVKGLLRVAQAFAPVLKANGGGTFAQLNSVASIKAFADFATYSASKAASYLITQALREKLAAQGTQVISVHPGPIATDMADTAGLTEIAEPASVVAEGLFNAVESGEFHVFPDSMAQQFWSGYQSYAKNVVEATQTEEVA